MLRHTARLLILTAALGGVGTAVGSLAPSTVVARIVTGQGPCSEVGGLGSVWVGNVGEATVARIDPATNRLTGKVQVGAQPCDVAIGADSVWVDGYGTGNVERIATRSR